MQARVKHDYRWKSILAFGGHEFTKSEWRRVPPASEQEARTHPHLELKEEKAVPAPAPAKAAAKPVEKPTAEAKLEEMINLEPIEVIEHDAPAPDSESKPPEEPTVEETQPEEIKTAKKSRFSRKPGTE